MLVYIFFSWDQVIDPAHSGFTQSVRAVFLSPLIWTVSAYLFLRPLGRVAEMALCIVASVVAVTFALMFRILVGGFNFGAAGTLLLLLYCYAILPIRSWYFLLFSIAAWGSFDLAEINAPGTRDGMAYINNLILGSGIALGMFAVISRELSLRSQYRLGGEVVRKDVELGELSDHYDLLRSAARRRLSPPRTSVFLSYRRADSEAISGRIRDRLAEHFGNSAIFMDIDSIPYGSNFQRQADAAAARAGVALFVVGPDWLAVSGDRARIDDEADPVRVELESVLSRNIPLIPILVLGASMPEVGELPDNVKAFHFLNAIKVDSGVDFHHHVDRLIRAIEHLTLIPTLADA